MPGDPAALGAQGEAPSARDEPTMGPNPRQMRSARQQSGSTGLSSQDPKIAWINNGNGKLSKVTLCRFADGPAFPRGEFKQLHPANWAAQLKILWERA